LGNHEESQPCARISTSACRVSLTGVVCRFTKPRNRAPWRQKQRRPNRSSGDQDHAVDCDAQRLWTLTSDPPRRNWKLTGPHFLGNIVHHAVQDPRDGKTLLVAARTGHLGPTIFRSTDRGRTWQEAATPPAFEPGSGRTVDHTFWLAPGHATERDVWYAGTSPQGLFRSTDGGVTWSGVAGFNTHPNRKAWCGGDQDGTPDGPKLHSILIDPRDPKHMYIGMSSGGIFESTDRGADWKPLNHGVRADFLPDPNAEFGHDPHCVRLHPLLPDRLYHQNHTGIYRLDRPADRWTDIGVPMPKSVGSIGFPMVLHPRDPDTLWVFPMDGTSVWPRVSPGGKPAVYRSVNAGKTWQRQAIGLPKSQAWLTVKRQAMTADAGAPVGVYFGTTSGEVWGSRDEGRTWKCLAAHLPEIYSVETM
jgi:photosystem II stability/assembly factor-like uncharacterized protein